VNLLRMPVGKESAFTFVFLTFDDLLNQRHDQIDAHSFA
jgi:hypothetical protein